MDILNLILRTDGAPRLAVIALVLVSIAWIGTLSMALFSKKRAGRRPRTIEIAAIALSILIIGFLTWVGHAFATPEQPRVVTPTTGGGTGTCASVRPGMDVSQVRTLLGTPSIERSSEDTMGPGATIMAFDDSRCVVHLLNGTVHQVE